MIEFLILQNFLVIFALDKTDIFIQNPHGEFRVDIDGASKWLNSVLYKLAYYRYGTLRIEDNKPDGWDRVRRNGWNIKKRLKRHENLAQNLNLICPQIEFL